MGQAFSKELKRFNVSLTEWRICAALRYRPRQRLSELAAHTSTEPSTLSRTVDGMLQLGLLSRNRSDADGRALALALTPEGNQLTERIIPIAQLYERVGLSGISAAHVVILRDALRRIHQNIATLDHEGER